MKIFLDANVIYSAAKSESGASHGIFNLQSKYKLNFYSSSLALIEAERNLMEKENSEIIGRFYKLIKSIKIISVDSQQAKNHYKDIIEEKDAPILYGARQSGADFLLTLDRKHFFNKQIKAKRLLFKIQTPGDFILGLK